MNKIIAGLVILAIGLWATVTWWWFVWDILRGLISVLLVIAGLTLIGLGARNTASKTAEEK